MRRSDISLFARLALLFVLVGACDCGHTAEAGLDEPTAGQVDALVRRELQRTGIPGASIALVQAGRVVYVKAYGLAQLHPVRMATPAQRYRIGSITKQFVAAAVLRLQSQGRLHLDDPLSRHLPQSGTAGRATLRQLLTHTAGIREYLPQDYVFEELLTATTAQQLVERIGREPLDFAPGERWRYSNSGYVLAGAVVEGLAGRALFDFMREQIFEPLKMTSVVDADRHGLGADDPEGYSVTGLGVPRPTQAMAPGWLMSAGGLAMTAEDLARWDISLMERSLLTANEYQALGTEMLLNNGIGTRYALGLGVRLSSDRRMLVHDGGVPGFMAVNSVFPDDGLAIVVLTNGDFADLAPAIAGQLQRLLLAAMQPDDRARTLQDEQILRGLQRGQLARERLTAHANAYFSEPVLRETAQVLQRAGAVKAFELRSQSTLGGLDVRVYRATLEGQHYTVVTRAGSDGRIEQYTLTPD